MENTKICKICGLEKPLTDFWIRKKCKEGRTPRCKICSPKRNTDTLKTARARWRTNNPKAATIWARNNPEKAAKIHLKSRLKRLYNMTLENYYNLLENQGGVCKICGNPELVKRILSVDHCHDTGIIRGILCDRCNKVIGQVGEDIEILENMIDYLRGTFTEFIVNQELIDRR